MWHKFLPVIAAATIAISANADSYSSMEFISVGDKTQIVDLKGLNLSVDNGILKTTNDAGQNFSFPLSSLVQFAFSTKTMSLQTIPEDYNGEVTLYTTAGVNAGHFSSVSDAKSGVNSGIYICVANGKTYKLIVK